MMPDEKAPAPSGNGAPAGLIQISPGRPAMPARVEQEFGIGKAEWRALVDAIFPSAKTTEGVILALAYCRARKLDIFKRPVHVVPIWNSSLGREVESVWPGIGELRTTAMRTERYGGIDEVVFGHEFDEDFEGTSKKGEKISKTVTYPEWAQVTVYRLVGPTAIRCAFAGPKVYWKETYATAGRTQVPNEMWARRPYGQLAKCAEAAALRAAFPEELGETYAAEEMEGQRLLAPAPEAAAAPPARGTAALVDKLRAEPAGETIADPPGPFPAPELKTPPPLAPTGQDPADPGAPVLEVTPAPEAASSSDPPWPRLAVVAPEKFAELQRQLEKSGISEAALAVLLKHPGVRLGDLPAECADEGFKILAAERKAKKRSSPEQATIGTLGEVK